MSAPATSVEPAAPVACSLCFHDHGLRLDAEYIGYAEASACPNCGEVTGKKLPTDRLHALAQRFFVYGTTYRFQYGAAPVLIYNEHQTTSVDVSPWLSNDIKIFERLLGIGFFYYGPRAWMFGQVEPLEALQDSSSRPQIIDRILKEYPVKTVETDTLFYRLRIAPKFPDRHNEYDSPPKFFGGGRLDSEGLPVLYASPDLEVCVHECRVAAEDLIYVATLQATRPLRLLDLSVILKEDETVDRRITEFESLDIAVHFLFLAGKHSYEITRDIAVAASRAGFDGLLYPSYFSQLRTGTVPFSTTYGISNRRIPSQQAFEEARHIPNYAIFGRPIEQGLISVHTINKILLTRVSYQFSFGPLNQDPFEKAD